MNTNKNKPSELKEFKGEVIIAKNVSSLKVLLGVMALFAAAQILIPLKPVPITLQTIMISVIGLTYTPRLSFITVLTYISLGLIGLPMFIKFSGGINHLTGVTGGYLLGFLIAAPTMAWLKNFFTGKFFGVMTCCLIGHAIIYIIGITWLAKFIGFNQAVYSGFLIYIPSGLVKITIFSYLFSYINRKKN